jgi:hypothetical protein
VGTQAGEDTPAGTEVWAYTMVGTEVELDSMVDIMEGIMEYTVVVTMEATTEDIMGGVITEVIMGAIIPIGDSDFIGDFRYWAGLLHTMGGGLI